MKASKELKFVDVDDEEAVSRSLVLDLLMLGFECTV